MAASRTDLGPDAFEAMQREGAKPEMAEAVALPTGPGASASGRPRDGRRLTPTELEVARLAADGLTNAEIGGRPFISGGTAKVHLSHIYAQLGIANRAQLAAIVTARALRPSP